MQVPTPEQRIAEELQVAEHQVVAAVALLDEGSTVPFIARYRKEVTGGLDDTQLRTLEERLRYLRELDDRRAAVLESIDSQGKLTEQLRAQLAAADTKARVEDIYLPYKQKRRTKAMIAREAGLEPLADALLADPTLDPEATAAPYVNADKEVPDAKAALDGARAILIERAAEDADLVGELREQVWQTGRLVSKVKEGKDQAGAKFSDYFDFAESFTTVPSHRILAVYRGESDDVLAVTVSPYATDEEGDPVAAAKLGPNPYEIQIARWFGIDLASSSRPADRWLRQVVGWTWRTKLMIGLGIDVRMRLRQQAEEKAIGVFAAGVKDVLMAAPAGTRATIGLDPGLRTGVKVAVVDATGKVVDTGVIHPHVPRNQWDQSIHLLAGLCAKHQVELVAIGNGTASRETEKLVADLIKQHPELELTKAVVSESGASVYSASALAAHEFPDLDVSLRGAVSIARRLQDPLAELVKIDPKSIGVGQYQHDLSEVALSRSLSAVVEDCVNAVGVDVNTASVPLLTRVSGITETLAGSIVSHRDLNGPFRTRESLRDVPRLGPKAFEQAAGFLRIPGGDNPLDASAVHPEAYPVVHRIQQAIGTDQLIGNTRVLQTVKAADFVDQTHGLPTITDILAELDKPGRDPRPAFTTAQFTDGVETLADLRPGMVLEGQVTNVAAFGAFIDVGVHQDGLAHISALSSRFVSDPRDVVKPGDIVRVKVLEVDQARQRIGLTLRLDDELPGEDSGGGEERRRGARSGDRSQGGGARRGADGARGGRGRNGGGGGDGGRSADRSGRGTSGDRSRDGDGRRGDRNGGGRPRTEAGPANSAMADALRRAGLS